jgi:hypothetical protein
MWRLRQFKEAYFERFWLKLARYASAGTRVRQNKRGVLVHGKQMTAGNFFRFEAQMFGPDSNPLPDTAEIKAFISPLASDDVKERKEVKLTPKRTSVTWGGWFQGRHQIDAPGEYKVEVPIPGTPDFLRGKFVVRESNPELDVVRPDFAAMYQMAGEFTEIEQRLDKAAAEEIRKLLSGRRVRSDKPAGTSASSEPPDKEKSPEPRSDSPRLYFDLKTAKAIPDCMIAQTKVQRNRGQVDDLWDHGPAIGRDSDGTLHLVSDANPRNFDPNHWVILPWWLSAEWLTRKLLRLA